MFKVHRHVFLRDYLGIFPICYRFFTRRLPQEQEQGQNCPPTPPPIPTASLVFLDQPQAFPSKVQSLLPSVIQLRRNPNKNIATIILCKTGKEKTKLKKDNSNVPKCGENKRKKMEMTYLRFPPVSK